MAGAVYLKTKAPQRSITIPWTPIPRSLGNTVNTTANRAADAPRLGQWNILAWWEKINYRVSNQPSQSSADS